MKRDKNFQRKLDSWKAQAQRRAVMLDMKRAEIDEDKRTVAVAFSSEAEIMRWFGIEVLGHGKDEIDLTRFEDGGAVLVGHDTDDHVGVIEKAWVDSTTGRASIRFGKGDRASEIFQDVIDGIRRHISVGYFIHEMVLERESDNGPNVYRVSKWEPFEISFVAVPADISVGVGRTVGIELAGDLTDFSQQMLETALRNALTAQEGKKMEETEEQRDARLKKEREAREAAVKTAEKAARESAVASERERVAELIKVGETYGAADLAREAINGGQSVHELNQKILERGGLKVTRAEDPAIGLSDQEARQFSFNRLLNAMCDPHDRAAQESAAFELECSRAAAAQLKKDVRGAIVPYDVLIAKRSMSVGVAADGGDLVETELLAQSFIDKLENALALVQCGVTMLPGLNGNIAIPRQTGGASHFWLAENGAPTESGATFDQIGMTPKTVGAFTEISRRLLLQSSIGAEAFTINELALRLALAIDLAGINGSGAGNEPAGVLNYPGVGVTALGANGLAPTWDHIVDMETGVATANAAIGNLCYLTNAKVRGKLKKTLVDAGSGDFVWDRRSGDTPLNGYRTPVSNQVPSNLTKGTGTDLSAILFGNWADLIIGMWGGLDIQVNPYSLDTKGAVRVTSFQDVDIELRHPESFNIVNDAITT